MFDTCSSLFRIWTTRRDPSPSAKTENGNAMRPMTEFLVSVQFFPLLLIAVTALHTLIHQSVHFQFQYIH